MGRNGNMIDPQELETKKKAEGCDDTEQKARNDRKDLAHEYNRRKRRSARIE
jgi:hypothetical protein